MHWADEPVGAITDIAYFALGEEAEPVTEQAAGEQDPVTMIVTPISLTIQHTASHEESAYLRAIAEGKLLGARTGKNGKVYFPPHGADPATGQPTTEFVELPDKGTVTTFAIINIPFQGQRIKPPYVAAYVLLDGADIPVPAPGRRHRRARGADGHARRGGVETPRGVGIRHRQHRVLPAHRGTRRRVRHLQAPPVKGILQMSARNVAVVGFAHAPHVRRTDGTTNGVEMLMPCFAQLYEDLGITKADIGFWCSGSSDYLAGRAFSFISAIDSIGAVPPINESHVEMDAAWALYEAYIKILTGEVDTALVYGFGKSSAGILRQILSRQTDPYTVAPLWPDSVSMAGLQARMGLDSAKWNYEHMARVALDSFAHARRVDSVEPAISIDELLDRPFFADPLRRHDIAPITDGAAAIVLAADDRARELRENPAWITGIEHRIESPVLGARDLTESPSTTAAAKAATGGNIRNIDVAEIHAPFTHQHLILAEAIRIPGQTKVNPSGGALAANPMFVAGLERIGFAAQHIWNGSAERVLAHATSGPALQQNLVAVMEGKN